MVEKEHFAIKRLKPWLNTGSYSIVGTGGKEVLRE